MQFPLSGRCENSAVTVPSAAAARAGLSCARRSVRSQNSVCMGGPGRRGVGSCRLAARLAFYPARSVRAPARLPGSRCKTTSRCDQPIGRDARGGIWSNHETRSRRSRIDGPDLGQCNRNEDHRKMTDAMGNLMDLRPSFLKDAPPPAPSRNVLQALWQAAGMPDEALAHVSLTGADPVLPSSFAVGQAAQTSMAPPRWPPPRSGICAAARAAGQRRHAARGRNAAATSHQRRHAGSPRPHHGRVSLRRWRLGAHPRQLPHHRDGALALLGCPPGEGTPARRRAGAGALDRRRLRTGRRRRRHGGRRHAQLR